MIDIKDCYYYLVILGYGDKRTQAFADGMFVREFQSFDRQAWKRLEILDAAKRASTN